MSDAYSIVYEAHVVARCLKDISIYQIDIGAASVFILQDSYILGLQSLLCLVFCSTWVQNWELLEFRFDAEIFLFLRVSSRYLILVTL